MKTEDRRLTDWEQDEREVLAENTAQQIFQQLEKQQNLTPQYSRRWIWELFQNALDAAQAGTTSAVDVSIHLNDSFIFRHNGKPFTRKEILHLIFHGSTKAENPEEIGQHGTGFLTTHLISRKVTIRGMLNTGERFDFTLDRAGITPNEIYSGMIRSRDELRKSLSAATVPGGQWTHYEYPLGESASTFVGETVRDLARIGPVVLALNRKLRSIRIVSNATETNYVVLEDKALMDGVRLVTIGEEVSQIPALSLAVAEENDVAVGIPVAGKGSKCNAPLRFGHSGPRFLGHFQSPQRPPVGSGRPGPGAAGRDCTPRGSLRWKPALLPGSGTR